MLVYLLTRVWHQGCLSDTTTYHVRVVTPTQPYTLAENETVLAQEWDVLAGDNPTSLTTQMLDLATDYLAGREVVKNG